MTEISKEYAAALYMLACEKERKEEYKLSLEMLKNAFLETPEYLDFLASSSIPLSERLDAVKAAFSGKIPEDVLSYLLLLCEKRRVSCFLDSVDEFQKLFDASIRILNAKVTSAMELTDAEKEKLQKKLEAMSGCCVHTEYLLDESLIGGVVVEIDGKVLDGSVKSRLRDIKDVING